MNAAADLSILKLVTQATVVASGIAQEQAIWAQP